MKVLLSTIYFLSYLNNKATGSVPLTVLLKVASEPVTCFHDCRSSGNTQGTVRSPVTVLHFLFNQRKWSQRERSRPRPPPTWVAGRSQVVRGHQHSDTSTCCSQVELAVGPLPAAPHLLTRLLRMYSAFRSLPKKKQRRPQLRPGHRCDPGHVAAGPGLSWKQLL